MKKFSLFIALVFCFLSLVTFSACKSVNNVTTYEIDARLEGQTLTAVQSVKYVNNTENALSELKFNLFANAFRKDAKYSPISEQNSALAYPNGLSCGDMQIQGVKIGEKELEFAVEGLDKNVLTVKLDEEVFPFETVRVQIDFTVNLANVIARMGINSKTINLANFYPILCVYGDQGFYECVYYSLGDPFYSECADYKVKFTCDSEYVVAHSGARISATTNGKMTTHTFSADNLRSFAMVLCKDFETISDASTGVEINYYYYDDSAPLKSFEYAKKAVNYFSATFGEFPYKNYSVVQTPFVQGGMEFSSLVMISDSIKDEAYGEVIVHETAHQWWQTGVGNNEIEYGFLDEGLAEYSVIMFYENHPEYNLTRVQMVKSAEQTYKIFCTVSDKVFGKVNTVMIRSLKDFASEYEYVNIAYIKPCIMYDNLRTTVGEGKFIKALKKYYNEYCYKIATPDDLVGCFERVGAGTNGYFESFFDGKVII